MISPHTYESITALSNYHREHLASEDNEVSDSKAKWFGEGAKLLGLPSVRVTKRAFGQLCNNENPKTGLRLTQRCVPSARVATDFTISPPKSVSIAALVMDDPRVVEAHDMAVRETIVEVERLAQTRVRKNGANTDRSTGNIIAACFTHYTSRDQDPQLHTHPVVFNATFDAEENAWKALQAGGIYQQLGLLKQVYHATFIAELHRIGYSTRRTPKGFEIIGIPDEVIKLFSKRNADISRIEESFGVSGKPKLRKAIARNYRRPKGSTENLEDLRHTWIAQLSPDQFARLMALKDAAKRPVKTNSISVSKVLHLAASHLFERQSVVPLHKFLAECLIVGNGQIDLQKLHEAVAADNSLVVKGQNVLTRQGFAEEVSAVLFVNNGVGIAKPLAPSYVPPSNIAPEQGAAVSTLLRNPDRTMALTGVAGAGKSTVLEELHKALTDAGYSVLACAPTTGAANVLKKAGFAAITLQRLLKDRRYQTTLTNGVVIVDEAGMVSLNQLNQLFSLAGRNTRVILCGDCAQHKSVEAGDAFRLLVENSRMSTARVVEIHRQTPVLYRQIVQYIHQGHLEAAISGLNHLGWIKQISDDNRYQTIADDFIAASREDKSVLAVCATWREADLVSEQIRSRAKAAGLIEAEDHQFEVLRALHLTEAHRRQISYYQPGYVIVHRRKTKHFRRGEKLVVTGVDGRHLLVRNTDGDTLLLDLRTAAKFSVFTPHTIAISVGDQLQLLENGVSNDRQPLVNGETVRVAAVNGDSLKLDDGRTIGRHYRHFTYWYATTSQRAQASTVDRVFIAIDAQSAFCAATTETLYVSVSRGRERCTIYTDDLGLLTEAFQRSGDRTSVFELFSDGSGSADGNTSQVCSSAAKEQSKRRRAA